MTRAPCSSSSLRITTQLCSAVLPKPMPGSMITRSRGTPAATREPCRLAKKPLDLVHQVAGVLGAVLVVHDDEGASVRARQAWRCAGERVSPQMSLRIVAPAATAASATSSL